MGLLFLLENFRDDVAVRVSSVFGDLSEWN